MRAGVPFSVFGVIEELCGGNEEESHGQTGADCAAQCHSGDKAGGQQNDGGAEWSEVFAVKEECQYTSAVKVIKWQEVEEGEKQVCGDEKIACAE